MTLSPICLFSLDGFKTPGYGLEKNKFRAQPDVYGTKNS